MRLSSIQQVSTNPSFATVWVVLGGGLGFIGVCVGIYLYNDTRNFLAVARSAEGQIVNTRLEASPDSVAGASSSYLTVEFQTADRQTIRFQSTVGTLGNARRVGESVAVLYDPSNPQRAKINSFWEVQGAWVIFLLTGVVMVLTALAIMILT